MWGTRGAYSFFDHAADVGLTVTAPCAEELFAAAGRALMEWIGAAPPGTPRSGEPVFLEAADREQLLVLWLQELLYRFHQRYSYFTGAEWIEVTETSMRAQPLGLSWDERTGSGFQEVKAVTYHQLRVSECAGEWTARVILDI